MFDAAGKDMTRQSFVQSLEGGKSFETNVYPPLQFSAQQPLRRHAGARRCRPTAAAGRYKTIGQFVSGF